MNQNLKTPCIRNCCLDEQDICMGCFRSLAEITAWGNADASRREQILAQARQRQQQWEDAQTRHDSL